MIGYRQAARRSTICLMALLLAFWGNQALAAKGKAKNLRGTANISVPDCGSDRDKLKVSLTIKSNRRWSAKIAGKTYRGSYTQRQRARKLTLKLDSQSRRRVLNEMAKWATDLCGTRVVGTKVSRAIFRVQLNDRRTSLTGQIEVDGKGRTSQGAGRASYRATVSGKYKHGK